MFYIVIYVDKAGKFRFKLTGNNNEPLNDNYNQLQSAKDCVKLIKDGAADAKVFFESEDGSRQEIDL